MTSKFLPLSLVAILLTFSFPALADSDMDISDDNEIEMEMETEVETEVEREDGLWNRFKGYFSRGDRNAANEIAPAAGVGVGGYGDVSRDAVTTREVTGGRSDVNATIETDNYVSDEYED